MDVDRFDRIVRSFGGAPSRREVLRAGLAGLLGSLVAVGRSAEAPAKHDKKKKRERRARRRVDRGIQTPPTCPGDKIPWCHCPSGQQGNKCNFQCLSQSAIDNGHSGPQHKFDCRCGRDPGCECTPPDTCCRADGATCESDAICCSGSCVNGHCCQRSCAGKECGPDGCGGNCGTCGANETCNAQGQCVCTPSCAGKQCGPDGCGGSCGTCGPNETCSDQGHCVSVTCQQTCAGCCVGDRCENGTDDAACGADGESCANCKTLGTNGACVNHACVCEPSQVTCDPTFCGYVDDGCNNRVKCNCPDGLTCFGETCAQDVAPCAAAGQACGGANPPCCQGLICEDGVCGTGGGQDVCARRGEDCADLPCCNPGDTCAPQGGRHVCMVVKPTRPPCLHVGGHPGPGDKCCPRLHREGGHCVINRWDHCDPGDKGQRAWCEAGTTCEGGRLSPHGTPVCVPKSARRTRRKQRRRQKRQNLKEKTGQNRPNRPNVKDRLDRR